MYFHGLLVTKAFCFLLLLTAIRLSQYDLRFSYKIEHKVEDNQLYEGRGSEESFSNYRCF